MSGFPADAGWWLARLLRPVRQAFEGRAEEASDALASLPVVVAWGLETSVIPTPLVVPYTVAALLGGMVGRGSSEASTAILAAGWGGVVALHAAGGAFAAEPGAVWMQTGWAWVGTAAALGGFRFSRRIPLAMTGLGVGASLSGWTSSTLGLPGPWGVGLVAALVWPWVAEGTGGWASAVAGAALVGEVQGAPWGAEAWTAFAVLLFGQRVPMWWSRWRAAHASGPGPKHAVTPDDPTSRAAPPAVVPVATLPATMSTSDDVPSAPVPTPGEGACEPVGEAAALVANPREAVDAPVAERPEASASAAAHVASKVPEPLPEPVGVAEVALALSAANDPGGGGGARPADPPEPTSLASEAPPTTNPRAKATAEPVTALPVEDT